MLDATLPSHATVVVIGGGVMGCSTLYHLAEAGVTDAILLERNRLTSGTTWHSAAQVRALRSTRNLTDLIRYSVSLYAKLEEETGQATGWINKGSLSIATSEDRLVHIRRQEALAHLFGVRARSISVGEAKERWPLMNAEDVIGAVWSPGDGRVSPSDLCAALVKGARAREARIFEDTRVTSILTRDGRIAGVETSRGTVRCDAVALCAGLWSRKVAAMAGAEVPVWPCEHFYLLTEPVEGIEGNIPSLSDHDGGLYIRDDSGGLLIGCFEPHARPIDPDRLGDDFAFQLLPEDWDHFEPMMRNALHRLPALETVGVRMLLNGPESFTPDGSFLLGETAETRGLFLGCGMNSVGVATGGGAGMALAHCIVHGHAPTDLHEADPTRFPSCFNSAGALAERAPEVLGKHYEITYPARQWATGRGLRPLPLDARWRAEKAHFGQVYGFERPLYFGRTEEPALTFGKPAWFESGGTRGKARARGRGRLRPVDLRQDSREWPGRGSLSRPGLHQRQVTGPRPCHLHSHPERARWHRRRFGRVATRPRGLPALRRHRRNQAQSGLAETALAYGGGGDVRRRDRGACRSRPHRPGGRPGGRSRRCRRAECARLLPAPGGAHRWRRGPRRAALPTSARPAGSSRVVRIVRPRSYEAAAWSGRPTLRRAGPDLDANREALPGLRSRHRHRRHAARSRTRIRHRPEQGLRRSGRVVTTRGQATEAAHRIHRSGGRGRRAARQRAGPARRAIVGKTTSAAFGYRIGRPVALALIDADRLAGAPEKRVDVDIAGFRHSGAVSFGAAYDPRGMRMRPLP